MSQPCQGLDTVFNFQPLQIGSYLLSMRSVLSEVFTLSGQKRLIPALLKQPVFQFTHTLDDQIADSLG